MTGFGSSDGRVRAAILDGLKRRSVRVLDLQEREQLFAHLAAQIPEGAWVAGADQGAQFDLVNERVGDLQVCHLAVPERALVQDLHQLVPDWIDRHRTIDMQQHSSDLRAILVGPVLERLFDKIRERHDQSAQIPDANDDIGAGDGFDPSRLTLDDDLVLDADRLGHCNLNTGEKVGEYWASCETEDDAGSTGRRKQADTVLPHRFKGHQCRSNGNNHQQYCRHPLQDSHLGDVLARQQIIFDVGAEASQINRDRNVDRDCRGPADGQNKGDQQHVPDGEKNRKGKMRRGQRRTECEDQTNALAGPWPRCNSRCKNGLRRPARLISQRASQR